MPSPVIPRSKSAPDISSPDSPTYDDTLNPSDKSIRSTRSTGSPIIIWPKKLTEMVTRKKSQPTLTEKNLQEFNKRNASSSPYYKGLIDYSLDINREKLSGTSPGRESRATTFVSSGSRTSFAVKFQEWGTSCFTSKRTEKSSSSSGSYWTKSSAETRGSLKTLESVPVTNIRSKTTKSEVELERKKVSFHSIERDKNFIPSATERPLRERDSEISPLTLTCETQSMQPVSPLNAVPSESSPYPLPEIYLPSPPRTIAEKLQTPPPSPPQEALPPPQEATLPPQASSPQHPAVGLIHGNTEISTAKNEVEYKWADIYRPSYLQDFLCNKEAARSLLRMVRDWDRKIEKCSHFIFEGNPGVGKRTMIWALLREAFGKEKIQARDECKKFSLKGEELSSIYVNLKVSDHHVEVNLSELRGYEKHVIVELIKENNENLANAVSANKRNCKAIILYEADKLSIDALSYIKWMLEKFIGKNKIFFCCSDASKLEAIKPMCTFVELLEPSNEEILEVLAFIAQREGIHLPLQLANKIAENAKHNLRQAIRSFEATWHFNGCCASLKEDQDIKTGWEDKIANIAQNVIDEQSPKQLYIIRGELQNLIEHNVAPEFIFQTLKDQLKNILPQHLKPQFDNLYEEYQKNHAIKKYLSSAHEQEELGKRRNDQRNNVYQFMRIEEFIARFMSWYKRLVIKDAELDQIQSSETT